MEKRCAVKPAWLNSPQGDEIAFMSEQAGAKG